ncbi:MAG: nucleotidyltransferase domain-containing protein [bacterium]
MGINRKQIEQCIAKKYGASKLILFGSALDEPEKARDLDLACDGIDGWKIFEFGASLEEELHISVDVVPLSPPTRFTRYIEKKGEILYAA